MNHSDIIKLPSGIYDGKNVDGQNVIVLREEGEGYIVKMKNSKNVWECLEYDESGYVVCDFVEYD